jgi:hypothetical protein
LEEYIASMFRIEQAEQDTSMKAGGKLSKWLAGNFGLYRKQEGSGRVDLSTNWLSVGQNETAELSYSHQANQEKTRTGV